MLNYTYQIQPDGSKINIKEERESAIRFYKASLSDVFSFLCNDALGKDQKGRKGEKTCPFPLPLWMNLLA